MALNELYQQSIKTHNQNPTGRDLKFTATHTAQGYNPSCGDELEVYLSLKTTDGNVDKIGFSADACAICVASASLMCEHAKDKSPQQLQNDAQHLSESLQQKQTLEISSLECLSGVSKHPSRINCALLPWKTLNESILNSGSSFVEED